MPKKIEAQPAITVGACRFKSQAVADKVTANHASFKATMDAAATDDDKAEAFVSFFNLKP